MKQIVKPYLKKFICLLVITFLSMNFVMAQYGDGGDDPDIPTIPLDGGLSMLLVAGAAYGGKKLNEHRKSRKK